MLVYLFLMFASFSVGFYVFGVTYKKFGEPAVYVGGGVVLSFILFGPWFITIPCSLTGHLVAIKCQRKKTNTVTGES